MFFSLSLYGMTGAIPRALAAVRLAILESPLSPMATRGVISGPISSSVVKCGASGFSPPVSSKAIIVPEASDLAWVFVVNPPRDRPRAWPCGPLLQPQLQPLLDQEAEQPANNPEPAPKAEIIDERTNKNRKLRKILPVQMKLSFYRSKMVPLFLIVIRMRIIQEAISLVKSAANSVNNSVPLMNRKYRLRLMTLQRRLKYLLT